ncbi:MAG: hypothetical protein VX015_14505 [Planctomycetota bacterium]|nr:hypothetical protein [Planctomycetota bacterium]MEC8513351.1 hypothetical protein [Planctomycetota bacterium]
MRWIVPLILLTAFGVHRVGRALRSTEQSVSDRIEFLVASLEERQPRRLVGGLTEDFLDETGRFDRRDVAEALRVLLDPGRRYRGTLREDAGLTFLSDPEPAADAVSVRVRCLIEARASGPGSLGATWRPVWDLELTADLVRASGTWRVRRTRDVNHDERPRW